MLKKMKNVISIFIFKRFGAISFFLFASVMLTQRRPNEKAGFQRQNY